MNQVIEKIILSQTITEDDMIKQYKEWSKEIQLFIPIKDQITQTLIKWPIRGKNCNHFTCIDMFSYLEMNLKNQNLEKYRWACPTCQARLYVKDIIFDKYLFKFIKTEIQAKIKQEYISLIDDVICDQNGNLKVGDESLQRIKLAQMKKFLTQENKKIEMNLNQNSKILKEKMKEQINKKINMPLEIPKITNEEIKTKLTELKQSYPKINKDTLQQMISNYKQLILSLNTFELVYNLMYQYDNLKDLTPTTYADVMYQQDIEDVVQVLKTNMKYNELQFSLIRFYSEELFKEQESQFCSNIAMIILFLIKKDQSQYLQIDNLTPSFILLVVQYSIFENNVSYTPPGILIGGVFYFYKHILNFSFERTCQLFRSFINLTGNESFYLSRQQKSIDFLADVISTFLKLQFSTNEIFDQVLFFQKIFFNKPDTIFEDLTQLNTSEQICLFQTIKQTLFRFDGPQYNQTNFKKVKEFISLIVLRNKDVIILLRNIQNQIF